MEEMHDLKSIAVAHKNSEDFWRKAIRRGHLPCVKIGRSIRVRESDLQRFLIEQSFQTREAVR